MLESLVLFVLVAAILVIFLHDFGKMLKKLFAIPGVALFLPLFLVSWVVVTFEQFFLWILLKIQIFLVASVSFLASLLPFTWGANMVAGVVLLMALTLLPMAAVHVWNKRRMFQAVPNVWLVGLFIWLALSMLLSLSLVSS